MSFFGLGASAPDLDASNIDERLESKFAYAVEELDTLDASQVIECDDEALNDETFGNALNDETFGNAQNEAPFGFAAQDQHQGTINQHNLQRQAQNQLESRYNASSSQGANLEDIEAQMRAARINARPMDQSGIHSTNQRQMDPNHIINQRLNQNQSSLMNQQRQMDANMYSQSNQRPVDPSRYSQSSSINQRIMESNQMNQQRQMDSSQMNQQRQMDPNQMNQQRQMDPNQMNQQRQINPNQMTQQRQMDPKMYSQNQSNQRPMNTNQMNQQRQMDPSQMNQQRQMDPNIYYQQMQYRPRPPPSYNYPPNQIPGMSPGNQPLTLEQVEAAMRANHLQQSMRPMQGMYEQSQRIATQRVEIDVKMGGDGRIQDSRMQDMQRTGDGRMQDQRNQDLRMQDPRMQEMQRINDARMQEMQRANEARMQDPRMQHSMMQDPRAANLQNDPRMQDPKFQLPGMHDPRMPVDPRIADKRQIPATQERREEDEMFQAGYITKQESQSRIEQDMLLEQQLKAQMLEEKERMEKSEKVPLPPQPTEAELQHQDTLSVSAPAQKSRQASDNVPRKILKRKDEKAKVPAPKQVQVTQEIEIDFNKVDQVLNARTKDVPVFEADDFPALGEVRVPKQPIPLPPRPKVTPRPREQIPQPTREPQSRQNQKQRRQNPQTSRREMNQFFVPAREEDSDENLPNEEKFKGLMRKFEKELIAKIQISNLVSDDPYADDFYYQVHTLLKSDPNEESPHLPLDSKKKWKQSLLTNQLVTGKGNSVSVSDQMQKQMKRLVEGRKTKPPREGTVSLEGALGKISVNTARNPKRAFGASFSLTPELSRKSSFLAAEKLSTTSILKSIEKLYDTVLELEQLKRQVPDKQDDLPEWEVKFALAKQNLFKALFLTENIPITSQHPLLSMLNFQKGMKILPRAFRFMATDQILALFSVIITRFECLEVSNVPLNESKDEVDVFMNTILPTYVAIISEANLDVINGLMRIFLERHNMVWLAKSRVGLALLTVNLSRSEILKSNNEVPSEQDVSLWNEIYNFVFASLQGQFTTLFPHDISPIDEVYLWQFLSALAVGASGIEHQRILVTEVRVNVIKTSKSGDEKALDNVNLFLNALGLGIDAAQLAAMG